MTEFKVGDRVRRNWGTCKGQEPGYEGVISRVSPGKLHFPDGTWGLASRFDLVQPTGPVVTETVTKTRIVPGTYDGVEIYEDTSEGGWVVEIEPIRVDGDTADRLAAVLSELAKGLRDA